MQIFEPNSFNPGSVNYIPTLEVPQFDISGLEDTANELLDIENNKLNKIEENYNSILNTQDALLGLEAGSVYGQSVLDNKKREYNINDDVFKLSMNDLKDPFKHRQIQSSLKGFMADPRVQTVLQEATEMKKFDNFIAKLERQNKSMATLAKADLNSVRNNADGTLSIYDLNPENYQEIKLSELITEELNNLPSDLRVEQKRDGNGFIIFSESRNFKMNDEEFSEMVAEKYSDDPRVQNTFRSRVDPTKPDSEKSINDPDAISKYLKDESLRAYNSYNGLTTRNLIKEDKIAVDNVRTANDILSKTTPSARSTATGVQAETTFPEEFYGKMGSTVGNDLMTNGYEVDREKLLIIDKLFEEGVMPQKTVNENGTIIYTIDDPNQLGEKIEVARFEKIPVTQGFIGTAQQERELNQNKVLRNKPVEVKNMVQTVRNNPVIRGKDGVSEGPLQDVFFDEVMYPQYLADKADLESDPEFLSKAAEKGIYGNKLFYLIHHNGKQKAKEYVIEGSATIKGNDQSDQEIVGAFNRMNTMFGENWDNIPTSEYIKQAESLNDPTAIYPGSANSSAFGAYQFTLSNWGDKLENFINERIPKAQEPGPGINLSEAKSIVLEPSSLLEGSDSTAQSEITNFEDDSKGLKIQGNLTTGEFRYELNGEEFLTDREGINEVLEKQYGKPKSTSQLVNKYYGNE